MVFNDLDKSSTETFCTLLNLVGDYKKHEDSVVFVGQQLGLCKDDISLVLKDWDDSNVMALDSENEKIDFIRNCFAFVEAGAKSKRSPASELYFKVLERLEVRPSSLN